MSIIYADSNCYILQPSWPALHTPRTTNFHIISLVVFSIIRRLIQMLFPLFQGVVCVSVQFGLMLCSETLQQDKVKLIHRSL